MPSITPDSPPETPLKPPFQMAVDSKTPARKKVPDSPTKVHGDGSMSPAQNGGLDSPVKKEKVLQSQSQIPTSAQAPEPNQAGKPQEIHSDDDLETSGDENESQADVTQEDPDAELPDFDYEGLEAQYREAITKATNKEDELLREFEAYSQVRWISLANFRLLLILTVAV